jgi:hypothetical protein
MLKTIFSIAFLCVTLLNQTVEAQIGNSEVFYLGETSFTYDQFFGSFDGEYDVAGELDTTNWIPTEAEGVGGYMFASDDSTDNETLVYFAAEATEDTTFNVFVMLYRAEGQILEGSIPNPTSTVNMFLLWGLDSLAIPEDISDSLEIADLLGAINAEHKLVGFATNAEITNREEGALEMTFGGTMVDIDNPTFIVTVTDGFCSLTGFLVDIDDSGTLRPDKLALSNYPNPFNPTTTIVYSSVHSGLTNLKIYDIAGRLKYQENMGFRTSGSYEFILHAQHWNSGLYLVQIGINGMTVAENKICLIK